MKPATRRSVLLSLPVLALTLGGCDIYEQTQGWHPRFDGVPAEAGDLGLRNVVVVTSSEGQATVLASFSNRGDADQLVEVRIGEAAATPAEGPLEIPSNGYASLGPAGSQVEFTGVDIAPGNITDVEFRFADAPRTTVGALVKKADGRYADITFAEPEDEEADS